MKNLNLFIQTRLRITIFESPKIISDVDHQNVYL